MITYSNIKRYDTLDFREYLNAPGFSHSFLKSEQFGIAQQVAETDKIILGKLVDAILTEPEKADMMNPLYPIARDIAAFLRKEFPYIGHFDKQVSYSAIAEYKGFKMPVKGRLDFIRKDVAHIDLKITAEKNVRALIAHMGYINSVWHYSKLGGSKNNYILIYSVPLKKAFLEPIDCSSSFNEFWAEKILKYGTV